MGNLQLCNNNKQNDVHSQVVLEVISYHQKKMKIEKQKQMWNKLKQTEQIQRKLIQMFVEKYAKKFKSNNSRSITISNVSQNNSRQQQLYADQAQQKVQQLQYSQLLQSLHSLQLSQSIQQPINDKQQDKGDKGDKGDLTRRNPLGLANSRFIKLSQIQNKKNINNMKTIKHSNIMKQIPLRKMWQQEESQMQDLEKQIYLEFLQAMKSNQNKNKKIKIKLQSFKEKYQQFLNDQEQDILTTNKTPYSFIKLGMQLEERKKYKQALNCFNKAIKMLNSFGENDKPLYAAILNQIAIIHYHLQENETAFKYLKQSSIILDLKKQLNLA